MQCASWGMRRTWRHNGRDIGGADWSLWKASRSPDSRTWCGYQQGRNPPRHLKTLQCCQAGRIARRVVGTHATGVFSPRARHVVITASGGHSSGAIHGCASPRGGMKLNARSSRPTLLRCG